MSLRQPLVSIIIPAYNHQDYILSCVNSALGQTYQNIEIIIINDGSTDRTGEILESIIDERIKLIQQDNLGTTAAINKGIKLAKGDYVSILNSDDIYHQERIKLLVDRLENESNAGFAVTKIGLIDAAGQGVDAGRNLQWIEEAWHFFDVTGDFAISCIKDNFTCTTSNFFFRKELVEQMGVFRDLRYVNDLDFLLRVSLHTNPVVLNEILLNYRVHDNNTIQEQSESYNQKLISELSYVLGCYLANKNLLKSIDIKKLVSVLADRYPNQLGIILFYLLFISGGEKISLSFSQDNTPAVIKRIIEQKIARLVYIDQLKVHNDELIENIVAQNESLKNQSEFIASLQNDIRIINEEKDNLWHEKIWINERYQAILSSNDYLFMQHIKGFITGREMKSNLLGMIKIIKSYLFGR